MSRTRYFTADDIADINNVSRFDAGNDRPAGHFRCRAEEPQNAESGPQGEREAGPQQQTMDDAGDGQWDSAALGDELMQGFAARLIRAKVGSICRALKMTRHDGEDLEQQIRLELLIRAKKFDPERGTWEAYVHCVANARARTHFRRLRRLPEPMPFSDVIGDLNEAECISERYRLRHRGADMNPDAAELHSDVQFVRDQLDLDAQMLTEMLKTCSVTEASREMDIPRSTLVGRIHGLQKPFSELRPSSTPDNDRVFARSTENFP